jgi:hypothetical protein
LLRFYDSGGARSPGDDFRTHDASSELSLFQRSPIKVTKNVTESSQPIVASASMDDSVPATWPPGRVGSHGTDLQRVMQLRKPPLVRCALIQRPLSM